MRSYIRSLSLLCYHHWSCCKNGASDCLGVTGLMMAGSFVVPSLSFVLGLADTGFSGSVVCWVDEITAAELRVLCAFISFF